MQKVFHFDSPREHYKCEAAVVWCFDNRLEDDAEKEARNHCAELERAASYLLSQIPELTVKPYFVDFEGVWEFDGRGPDAVETA